MTPGPVSDSSTGPPDGSPLDAPVHLVFADIEGTPDCSFVETETPEGEGVRCGEWDSEVRPGYRVLKVTARSVLQALDLEDSETLACAFCGHAYEGPKPLDREQLIRHVRRCDQHPARELVVQLKALAHGVSGGAATSARRREKRVNEVLERWGAR